jgi:hypothetical protein
MIARKPLAIVVIFVFCSRPVIVESAERESRLDEYIAARTSEFMDIAPKRRQQIAEITAFMRSQAGSGQPTKLMFICTHNSRRSQMAQVWAALAASHYGVSDVEVYSGGTERTAFNPRGVAGLERAGVPIKKQTAFRDALNPRFEIRVGFERQPLVCFSKVYTEAPNPKSKYAAVMTCAEADKNCPHVVGAKARIALPYDDPKSSDGTSKEAKNYDERCAQIAREMLFAFSHISRDR